MDAHTPYGASPARVLEWLVDEWPAQFDQLYPNADTWGTTDRAVEGMAAAEAMFGPAGSRE